MARFYIPQNASVTMQDGRMHHLRAGVDEVPDEVMAHPYVKGLGLKPESEMTDEDRYAVEHLGQNQYVGVIDNRPESDVNRTSAVDARDLVEAAPGTRPNEVGNADRRPPDTPVDVKVPEKKNEDRFSSDDLKKSEERKDDDKQGSFIPGPKPGMK